MNSGDVAKRAIDVTVGGLGLVLASPVLGILAALVRWKHGSPVLFKQARAGLSGTPFMILKLRSMTDARDDDGALLPDEQRLTSFGRWLRSTSLDELPALWNVVVGDMSLVGPRPLPVAYLSRYTERELTRHRVRPGITGLAQVSGRNAVPWEERLELDVRYVETRSIALDLRILARTVWLVLKRDGIAGENHATMAELRPPHSATS